MRLFMPNMGLALTVIVLGGSGCANHNPVSSQEKTEASTTGAAMQQGGIMSQSDYVRLRGLSHRVSQTHAISDTDLNWTIAQLGTQKNSVARARVFNTLAEIRPMSSDQQAKILPAITPFLSSTDRLDQLGALQVQKATQGRRQEKS